MTKTFEELEQEKVFTASINEFEAGLVEITGIIIINGEYLLILASSSPLYEFLECHTLYSKKFYNVEYKDNYKVVFP